MDTSETLLSEQDEIHARIRRLRRRIAGLEDYCKMFTIILILLTMTVVILGTYVVIHTCRIDKSLPNTPEFESVVTVEEPILVQTAPIYGGEYMHNCPVCGWAAEVYPCENGWYCECTFCGWKSPAGAMVVEAIEKWNTAWEAHS